MHESDTNIPVLDTENFYDHEVADILKNVNANGPIESFSISNEADLLAAAVETGVIAPGTFDRCGAFGDEPDALEEKKYRYEAKRVIEIQKILDSVEDADDRVETNEKKSQALYIDQTMARAVLVEAARKYKAALNTGSLSDRDARLYDESIDAAQEVLFPAPDADIAAYAVTRVIAKAESTDPAQAAMIREAYPFMRETESAVTMLDAEKKADWQNYLHETFDPVFDKVFERMGDTELSNATLAQASRLFMEEAGLPMKDEQKGTDGWSVVERDDVAGFRVSPGARELICGTRKQEITRPNFEKLILHEVVVHATRAQNGLEAHNSGLQNGLPGSQETEEGLGLLVEGLWSDGPLDSAGRDHFRYLAVMYADGQLDGERHTETETFAFASMLQGALKKGRLNDREAMKTARKLAFDHVKRAYRGMPPGKIMYSNLSYLSGKVKMAGLLAGTKAAPAATLAYLQQGKFNPFDGRHTELVDPLEP